MILAGVLVCIGCSQKSEAKPPGAKESAGEGNAGEIDALLKGVGITLDGYDEGQKRWLSELVDKYQSPCGKPHSLKTSLKSDSSCRRSVFAARYLVKLIHNGLLKSEAEDYYESRFVNPEKGECNLAGAPTRGASDARVVLCEFSDFQCPHCRLMEPILARLLEDFRGQIRVVHKSYPLSRLHADARAAAAAAVAAGKQGKFWQMHDLLFEHQDRLTAADLERYAGELKLDIKRWKGDLAAGIEQVDRDHAEGEKLQISGTPTLYINGRKFRQAGILNFDDVKDWVEEELNK